MEEFKPIETQEQFDAMISSRISRVEKSIRAEYGDYAQLKEASSKWGEAEAEYKRQLAEAQSTIRRYETDSAKRKIADEIGLPAGMAARLRGETEDEMRADATALLSMMSSKRSAPPMRNEEAHASANGYFAKLSESLKK